MEVRLLWRRPNAKSGALLERLRLLHLAEFVRYTEQLLVGHQSGSQICIKYNMYALICFVKGLFVK